MTKNQNKSNIIRLFTTEGCLACDIVKNLISKAITQKHAENIVKVEIVDCQNNYYTQFLKNNDIYDFPAICFIKDNQLKSILIGTVPSDRLAREIEKRFDI